MFRNIIEESFFTAKKTRLAYFFPQSKPNVSKLTPLPRKEPQTTVWQKEKTPLLLSTHIPSRSPRDHQSLLTSMASPMMPVRAQRHGPLPPISEASPEPRANERLMVSGKVHKGRDLPPLITEGEKMIVSET